MYLFLLYTRVAALGNRKIIESPSIGNYRSRYSNWRHGFKRHKREDLDQGPEPTRPRQCVQAISTRWTYRYYHWWRRRNRVRSSSRPCGSRCQCESPPLDTSSLPTVIHALSYCSHVIPLSLLSGTTRHPKQISWLLPLPKSSASKSEHTRSTCASMKLWRRRWTRSSRTLAVSTS